MPNIVDTTKFPPETNAGQTGFFKGYISNFRVTIGQALYTGNFAVPTSTLTTGSVGTIGLSPTLVDIPATNLLRYSEDFSDVAWFKGAISTQANTVVAPDGTITADKIIETATTAQHLIYQTVSVTAQSYTFSIYAKAADWNVIQLQLGSGGPRGDFDLINVTSVAVIGATATSITSVGNGWYRCSVTGTPAAGTMAAYVYKTAGSYAGDGSSGVYIWGAQFEPGTSATNYTPTTSAQILRSIGYLDGVATNLFTYSQEFNDSSWLKTRGGVLVNKIIAPDGTLTADYFTANGTGVPYLYKQIRLIRYQSYTLSCFVKQGDLPLPLVRLRDFTEAGAVTFDIVNGTITGSPSGICSNASIVDAGNGWFRISAVFTPTIVTGFHNISPVHIDATATSIFGFYCWGAQLETGTLATNYIPTSGVPVTRSATRVASQITANSVAVLSFLDTSNVTTNFGSIPGIQFVSNTVTNPIISTIKTGLSYNQSIVEPWQTAQVKPEYLEKIAPGDVIRITNLTTGANVTTNVVAVNKDTITFTRIPGFDFTYTNNYSVQNLSTTVWPTAQVTTTDWRQAATPRERLATQFAVGNKSLVKNLFNVLGEPGTLSIRGNLNLYNNIELTGDNRIRVRNVLSNATVLGNTVASYLDDSDLLLYSSTGIQANASVLQFDLLDNVLRAYRDGNLRVTDNVTGTRTNVQIIGSSLNTITIDSYFDTTSNLTIESRNVSVWPKLTRQPLTKPSTPREYLWFVENFPAYLRSRLDYPVLIDPGRRESRIPRFQILDRKTLHEPKIDLKTQTTLSFYYDFTANYHLTTVTGISTIKYNTSNFYINDEDILTTTTNNSAIKILYIPPGGPARYLPNSQIKIRDVVSGNVALYTVVESTPVSVVINTTDVFASNILLISKPVRETSSAFFANGVPRITPQFGVTETTPLTNLYYATYFPTVRNRTYRYLSPIETNVSQRALNKTDLMDNTLDLLGPKGDTVFRIPGTYQWRAPRGVTSVSVVAVGAGGGGSNYGDGGGGGGLGWGNVSVVPGQVYTVRVGAGGAGGERSRLESKGSTGGDSWFISNSTVAGFGGIGGGLTFDNAGGGFVGQGGGWGGAGGKWTGLGYRAGAGGGGAGGFTANGGRGGYSHTLSSVPPVIATASTGGGGGGGAGVYNSPFLLDYAGSAGGGGGGVGIYGNVGLGVSTIIDEKLDPSATLQYWLPKNTFFMAQFGGLGAGTAHGYLPSTSFYLNIPNLSTHDKVRYQFYWHFVDSTDYETNYLEIDGVRYLQFTKGAGEARATDVAINRCTTFGWVGNKTYTYSPWGNNTSNNGYFIIDTGWINHSSSSIIINHFFGPNQDITDEACYISHATFQIWNGLLDVVAGSSVEPLTETVRYESMNYVTTGSVTLTATAQTTEYSMFKLSGSAGWDSSVYSTTPFTAPCTIEFFKNAVTPDNGASYAMIGWNSDPLTNSSYDTLDYCSYPYRTDAYSVHHNGTEVQLSGSWDPLAKFYIVYDTDGYIRHYNGSKLLYSVLYGSRLVYFDSSFYSVNATFGGFSNVRVIKRAWNGSNYKALPNATYARTIYDAPGYYIWTVPQGVNKINVYLWGGGGAGGRPGGWSFGSPGGAGGSANATLDVVPGTSYYITVGSGGNFVGGDFRVLDIGGGGSACFNTLDNSYGGGGGGYSGIFLTSTRTQANAVIIAGGGGGGGSSRAGIGNQGGAGGGAQGQDGASPYDNKPLYRGRGGTQTAAGVDASSDSANTAGNQGALQGGNSRTNSYGGGGGGGYWGGSGGGYSESNTMAGGGGGSGYFNGSLISIANLVAGEFNLPGDSANPLRGNIAGNSGAASEVGWPGRVVIDVVITGGLPGWGGQYGTSVPVYTADFKPVDGVAGGLYGGGGSGGSNPTSGLIRDAGYAVAGGAGAGGAVRIIYGNNAYYPETSRTEFTTGNTLIAQSTHRTITNRLSTTSRDLLLLTTLAPGYRGVSLVLRGKRIGDDRAIYSTISKGVGNFTSKLKLIAPILNESVTILRTRGFIRSVVRLKGTRDLLRLGNLRTPRLPYNEAATSLYLSKSGRIELFRLNPASSKLFDVAERKKEPISFWS